MSYYNRKETDARIETGFVITETGCEPLCPEMDAILMEDVK